MVNFAQATGGKNRSRWWRDEDSSRGVRWSFVRHHSSIALRSSVAAAATASTTAAAATTSVHHFFQSWHAAFLQGFADEAIHGVSDGLKGVLGTHETLNQFMLVGLILEALETTDVSGLQLCASAVPLLQAASESHDFTVEGHRLLIS
jgi:hypothetical protein